MSRSPAPKHSTWEKIDIDDPDQDPQHAKHERVNPNDTTTPPRYSGYAQVQPFLHQYQVQPSCATAEQEEKDEGDNSYGFIKTALFPRPPTVAESGRPHPPPYTSLTFPPPTSPPSSTSNGEGRPHRREQCYFETLDFSDYLPPDNPGSSKPQHYYRLVESPSGMYSPRMVPLFHSAAMSSHNTWRREYRPRGCRASTVETQAGRLYGGYGAVGGSSLGADCDRATAGRLEWGDQRRTWKWRAVREAVALVLVVLLVVGVFAVKARGGGRFVAGESSRGVNGVEEWGPCTAARPRFCRLVVGAEE